MRWKLRSAGGFRRGFLAFSFFNSMIADFSSMMRLALGDQPVPIFS
jgi:hypothetical protein